MKKIIVIALLLTSFQAFSQKKKEKKLSDKETKELLSQLKMDDSYALQTSAENACKCIDSISVYNKGRDVIAGDISDCIHKEVMMYQILKQTMNSLFDTSKNNTILISDDKESSTYKRDYYELERWMRDSCPSLKNVIANNNEHNRNSVSGNEEALKYYNLGIEKSEKEQYADAIPFYKKALEIDSKFAFCWDNLGICYRKLGKYAEALDAYNNSLKADPKGITPLQNIAVVYEYQKEYQKAVFAYKNLTNVYKKDPEGYYGLGRMYFMLNDYENALRNMCNAYNLYLETKSPYRSDAEKVINVIYQRMKSNGTEKTFESILKEYKISPEGK